MNFGIITSSLLKVDDEVIQISLITSSSLRAVRSASSHQKKGCLESLAN